MKNSSNELRILSRRAKITELILRGVFQHLARVRQGGRLFVERELLL